MRARCTNYVRSVSRLENEAVLDRMAERLKKRPEILDRRREVVEHPFGSIKQWMYQGAFLMRGLANVRAEFLRPVSLTTRCRPSPSLWRPALAVWTVRSVSRANDPVPQTVPHLDADRSTRRWMKKDKMAGYLFIIRG